MQKEITYCRMAPSLGALEDTPENIWGTPPYDPEQHGNKPTVFFGLYGLPDFYALWRHKGKKYILWAGSDITHFRNGYWLEDSKWGARLKPRPLAEWIQKHCESWVENAVEKEVLKRLGIDAKVCPSFLGDIQKFDVSYVPSSKPKVYSSVSSNDFVLYRWNYIELLAKWHPDIEFNLYGNTEEWKSKRKNVVVHGRVTKEQMNKETQQMQGALRLVKFDGFSEILAKSILWGQWPISAISYPYILTPVSIELDLLGKLKDYNILGRKYYLSILNKFPWNENNY